VPGLIAVAQSSTGSVANVEAIQAGEIESGFAQSDVAYAAFTATGPFAGKAPADRLRALANLYHESVHLVVRADSDLHAVTDLKGRRVSLDAEGSGSIVDARLVLAAFGLSEADLEASYTPLAASIDRMRDGELDAFFLTAGWPVPAVLELAGSTGIRLLPIAGPEVDRLLAGHPFLMPRTIPADAYPGVTATPTVAVGAEWLVGRDLADALVYGLCAALWSPSARTKLDAGHPRGSSIRLATALAGIAIPLHPGAARYYREHGLLP
jgi:TRAP transporter TAXI family solute receptor